MKKIVLFAAIMVFATRSHASPARMIDDLSIDIQSVTVDSITSTELYLQTNLKVYNPNNADLDANSMSYRFSLELQPIASGELCQKITLPAKKESFIKFPVKIRSAEATDKIEKLATKDTLIYGLSGEITPSGLFSFISIPYETAGYIPNLRMPTIELAAATVTGISLTSVDLAVTLSINNVNSFAFVVKKLEYELFIDAQRVKEETLLNPLTAAAKSETAVTLPIALDPLAALDVVDQALSGEPINIRLQGWAEVETPLGIIRLPVSVDDKVQMQKK